MAVNARFRLNPFTGTMNAVLIVDEPHTVEFINEINAYGIYANEGVRFENPSTVIITDDDSAAATYTEVSRLTAPSSGQFRVDYDAGTGYFNTGFIEFNPSDVGKEVLLTYYGTGTILHPTFRLNQDFNLPGNASVENNLTVDNDADIVNNLTVGGNISSGDSNPLSVDDNVNLTLGKKITHAGTFIYGYLEDGTPIYVKKLSSSFLASDTSSSVLHGVSSAKSLGRIISVTGYLISSTSNVIIPSGIELSNDNVIQIIYNDTEITLNRGATSADNLQYELYVTYKD